jgi:hypothetical protein
VVLAKSDVQLARLLSRPAAATAGSAAADNNAKDEARSSNLNLSNPYKVNIIAE